MKFHKVIISLVVAVISSCASSDNHLEQSIAEIYSLIASGKYDEAQLKAMKTEALLNDGSPVKYREQIARLYGTIYYQQNIRDKAKRHIGDALKYATEMNDTPLIIINQFNLGLCASTGEEAVETFRQAANLAQKSGNKSLHSSALEKLAQAYISSNKYSAAQKSLDEAAKLCCGERQEIAVTQFRLWLAEGKYDAALEGYKSLNPDSLNVYGHLLRTSAIYDILTKQGDYKNALAYKDSVYFYSDSIKRLDGSKQAEEIEQAYRADLDRKNLRFKILLWTSLLAVTTIAIILFLALKNLRLKRYQIELNDKISALNARIIELMTPRDEIEEILETDNSSMTSVAYLIKEKYELSLEVLKSQPQYEWLRKLNLIRNMNSENKIEVKAVYDAIVGRFSSCCSDIRQAFPGLTSDDSVFCTLNFAGCSKEVISAAMGSSEEALRRRKSRIKQKLPEELFMFFFKK